MHIFPIRAYGALDLPHTRMGAHMHMGAHTAYGRPIYVWGKADFFFKKTFFKMLLTSY